jgi:hypothetical protein
MSEWNDYEQPVFTPKAKACKEMIESRALPRSFREVYQACTRRKGRSRRMDTAISKALGSTWKPVISKSQICLFRILYADKTKFAFTTRSTMGREGRACRYLRHDHDVEKFYRVLQSLLLALVEGVGAPCTSILCLCNFRPPDIA